VPGTPLVIELTMCASSTLSSHFGSKRLGARPPATSTPWQPEHCSV
jgi:hypothetical protein